MAPPARLIYRFALCRATASNPLRAGQTGSSPLLGEGEAQMSNLHDAVGLRVPYGNTAQYDTEFEPAIGTVWGYFNPKETPCFSLGLLKDIRAHDSALAANGGKVDIGGSLHTVN